MWLPSLKTARNTHSYIQCTVILANTHTPDINKRTVRFQKLTRNVFLTLHGQNVHRQQRQLSKFLMRYQHFASPAYCGAAGPVSKMASQQENAFCVLRFEVSRSVITVQREFRARFRKHAPCVGIYIYMPIIVAARSKACDLRPLACWDCGFESRRGGAWMSVVSVVCYLVEVSAVSWSLVQRSTTDFGV